MQVWDYYRPGAASAGRRGAHPDDGARRGAHPEDRAERGAHSDDGGQRKAHPEDRGRRAVQVVSEEEIAERLQAGSERGPGRMLQRESVPGLEPKTEGLEQKFLRIRRGLRFWTRNTKVILAAVIVLCLGGIIFGEYGLLRIIEVKHERKQLEAEITLWKMKQALLEDEKQSILNDPFTLERLARERCGLYRPGELIFVFPSDTTSVTSSNVSLLTR